MITEFAHRLARVAALAAVLAAGAGTAVADDGQRSGWGDPCRPANEVRSAAIHDLYRERGMRPVWITRDGRTGPGRRLVRLLRDAGQGVMTDCLAEALSDTGRYAPGEADVLLTDAYLALSERRETVAVGVHERLAPLALGASGELRRALADLAVDTRKKAGEADADAGVRMSRALARYRAIAESGGWPSVAAGPALAPGDQDPRVAALRERLAATGDLRAADQASGGNRYEGALVDAVIGFQARHGLEPDGVVGPSTRRALNVPARQRVARLAINQRRIEASAIDGDGPVVRVNIPDFRVMLYENGRVTYRTRAVVGRPDHATPTLQTRITALTLNPAWNVPRTIVRETLAEQFARDAGYAERNGFHAANTDRPLSDFDWTDDPMVPVRQAPGPTNALGRIKFEMPNGRAIYLHDTPDQHLFSASRRAFSAGCVRVEEPMALATRLTGLSLERLEAMAESGETRTVRLGWKVPVQIVYFTAWVDPRGRVQFRPDVYGRDEPRLANAA